jgi:hypothetical protein
MPHELNSDVRIICILKHLSPEERELEEHLDEEADALDADHDPQTAPAEVEVAEPGARGGAKPGA